METVNGTQRLSGIRSIINWDSYDGGCDFSYTPTKMAAAAVAVNSSYSSYPSDAPSRYEVASTAFAGRSSSLHGLISQTNPRWPTKSHNDSTQSQPSPIRLSLPSIHEALRPQTVYEDPVASSLPPQDPPFTRSQTPSIPRTYPLSEKPYFAPNVQRNSSQHANPQQNNFPRSLEPLSTSFPETVNHSAAPAPKSQSPYNTSVEEKRYEHENQSNERPLSGHSHRSPNHHNYDTARTSSMPPCSGQSTSAFIQPDFSAREYQESYESWRKSKDNEKPDSAGKFRGGIKRNLDGWDFKNNIAEINISSSALQEWSAHYNAIAQDKHLTASALTERMPSIDSIQEISKHQQKISTCLGHLARIISEADQQKGRAIVEQRPQEKGGRSGDYEEETTVNRAEEPKSYGFVSEAKKRRGRAAPPGRCHSCNRAETPEWRRGPDGARTLCNACGLHYAKLTRKNTTNKSTQGFSNTSNRPKSLDISPRPL